jgi:hypothetical protein
MCKASSSIFHIMLTVETDVSWWVWLPRKGDSDRHYLMYTIIVNRLPHFSAVYFSLLVLMCKICIGVSEDTCKKGCGGETWRQGIGWQVVGFIWHRRSTRDRLLWIWQWAFRFPLNVGNFNIIIIIIIYLTANVLSPGGSGYNAWT